ncbi:hypothetical protein [Methylocystis sp.]|uniref:hypothetical protein n=1 Tax=Methylocystis sp. TaxID=1911079 RepID=UPI0027366E0E|nr:hypothetical protein [Methylocystis sp.]MDP3553057.1 hypothetical protein [Methylocystis sp.]
MFKWLRRRSAIDPFVESDARTFIERYGDDAYLEARLRQHGDASIVEGNRPPGHWERVKVLIRERMERR